MRLSRRLRFSSFVRCLGLPEGCPGTKRAPRALLRLSSTLTAMGLAYETKGLLTGESARNSTVQGIQGLLLGEPSVRSVNELLTVHFGPDDVLANISLDFVDGTSLAEVEQTVARLERRIKSRFPAITRVFLEVQAREHHEQDAARSAADED